MTGVKVQSTHHFLVSDCNNAGLLAIFVVSDCDNVIFHEVSQNNCRKIFSIDSTDHAVYLRVWLQ